MSRSNLTYLRPLLLVLLLGTWFSHAAPGQAFRSHAPYACASADAPQNNVIRFYLAVDRRQFAAAYTCVAPGGLPPFARWVAGYAHTLRTRLLLADPEVPNGTPVHHVAAMLYTVSKIAGRRVVAVYAGRWHIDGMGYPDGATMHLVSRPSSFDVPRALKDDALGILSHRRVDVTGDGVPDDIYLTSGAGCASCHAQEVWVYSGGRLVFQQPADDAVIHVRNHHSLVIVTDTPNSPGLDSCCATSRTYETWDWTPYGFSFGKQRIVHVHH